jgi:hypothetical protein
MSLSFKATYFSDFVIMHLQHGQMIIAKHSATCTTSCEHISTNYSIVLGNYIILIDTVADRKKSYPEI